MDYLKGYFSPINTFNSGRSYCDTLDNRSHLGADVVVPIAKNAFSTQGKGRCGKTHLQQTQYTCVLKRISGYLEVEEKRERKY